MSLAKELSMLVASFGVGASLLFAGVGAVPAYAQDCNISDGSIRTGLECAVDEDQKNTKLFDSQNGLFQRITNILLFLVGAISVIMLIIGGIRYVISAGDQNAVTGAKNTIMYAIIGVIVALVAYGAIDFILGQFEN